MLGPDWVAALAHTTTEGKRLGLGTETPEQARFLGPKGIMDASDYELRHSRQAGVDRAPSYYSSGFPRKMREEYVRQWHAEHDPVVGPALKLIYNNPGHPWTVANLAAAVGSSRAVFASRFT